MSKCVRCGKSTLIRGNVFLADETICLVCFKMLGFKISDVNISTSYHYDDIKDGADAYYARKARTAAYRAEAKEAAEHGMSLSQYEQLNDAMATDNEIKIFSAICAVLADDGYDPDPLIIAPGINGSLLVMLDGTVMLEYKAEPQVKWIRFTNESEEKIRITGPGRINSLASRIAAAYEAVSA